MMNNELTVFDRFPSLLPTQFEKTIPSSIFDVFDSLFNTSELRKMTVYPTDIYELYEKDKPVATVIEIATAGINKENCKVRIDGNKLFVDIDNSAKIEEPMEKENKRWIQKQIAKRSASMSWTIGNNIDKKKVEVKYTDGVFKITLPYNKTKEKEIIDIEIK